MKRRGFLSLLGLSGVAGAAPMAALASERASPRRKLGFEWRTFCPNPNCGSALSQWVDLGGPVHVANQCNHCLWVIDTSELHDRIAKYMTQNSVWNGYEGRLK